MSASLHRLLTRPERLRRDEGDSLRQALLPFIDDPAASPQMVQAGRQMLAEVARLTASSNRWAFVMISPVQFGAVVRHLRLNSVRPAVAVDLWTMCFRFLIPETGEVLLRREQFADELGVAPGVVSKLMSELVAFGAVRRERERIDGVRGPGVVRYFVNPNAGTHLGGQQRDAAQAAAPVLELVGGTARPSERRSRAPSFGRPVL